MSGFLLALALLFTFGAGMCAGWRVSTHLVAYAIATGRMRALIEEYEAGVGRFR